MKIKSNIEGGKTLIYNNHWASFKCHITTTAFLYIQHKTEGRLTRGLCVAAKMFLITNNPKQQLGAEKAAVVNIFCIAEYTLYVWW